MNHANGDDLVVCFYPKHRTPLHLRCISVALPQGCHGNVQPGATGNEDAIPGAVMKVLEIDGQKVTEKERERKREREGGRSFDA